MSTPNRIVLCDACGDELFSGSSLLSEPPPPPAASAEPRSTDDEDDDEPIPATLRSNVLEREPVSRPIIVEEVDQTAA
jgi:hypothetical protein